MGRGCIALPIIVGLYDTQVRYHSEQADISVTKAEYITGFVLSILFSFFHIMR